MHAFVNHMMQLDVLALEQIEGLRWGPATALFVLASAWWVKGPLFVAIAALRDVTHRRWLPLTAACAAASLLLASLLSDLLKQLVERPRPELTDGSIDPAVATPDSPSFPSGHTTTAFAAAVAVSVLQPRLRAPLMAVAALVGVSRAYLGVHFLIDVMAGAALGTAVGLGVGLAARALARHLARRRPEPAAA
jgi:undecaprenyl-diphosphatase